jgi:hypothetical protein
MRSREASQAVQIDSGGGASKNGNFLTSGRPIETI